MTSNQIERIFSRHAAALRRFISESNNITSDAVLLGLALALQELTEAMQQENADVDEQLADVERVLKKHDSKLYADVVNGRTDLATAFDALISRDRVKIAQRRDEVAQVITALVERDADNARLTQELATLRSWVTTPSTGSPAEVVSLHAQVAELQSAVHYWRERALHCNELEPEGT